MVCISLYRGFVSVPDSNLVYPDGNVCISILHTGEDRTGYELASERWSPVQSVEKVILSVISMLAGASLSYATHDITISDTNTSH